MDNIDDHITGINQISTRVLVIEAFIDYSQCTKSRDFQIILVIYHSLKTLMSNPKFSLFFGGLSIKGVFTPWRVNDRDSMSLMICRGHIRASKGALQIFLQLTVLCKNWSLSQIFECL